MVTLRQRQVLIQIWGAWGVGGFPTRNFKVWPSWWIRIKAPLGTSSLRRDKAQGRFAGICQAHLYKPFPGNRLCAYTPPLPVPILVGHSEDSCLRKLGHPVSWCAHLFIYTANIEYLMCPKFCAQLCPQNVDVLVGITIMIMNNSRYHFLKTHSGVRGSVRLRSLLRSHDSQNSN